MHRFLRSGSLPVPDVKLSEDFPGRLTVRLVSSTLLETDWFDVYAIQDGMEGGSGPSHSPKVWIDTARGNFYYKQHD